VLDAARASPKWPASDFQIKMGKPTLEGAAGIFRYEDTDGAIGRMRECLLDAIVAAGGMPAIGGGDRSKAKTLPGGPGGSHPPPHIPDIVHSTAVRWTAEPADRAAALAGFERAAATWSPQQITVTSGARAVLESTPFMHMPYADAGASEHGFWRSIQGSTTTTAMKEQLQKAMLAVLAVAAITFVVRKAI